MMAATHDHATTRSQMLEVGQTWRVDFGEGNPNNQTIHIRAVVDDAYVVFRAWSKRKQRWMYAVEPRCYFDLRIRDGFMKQKSNAP